MSRQNATPASLHGSLPSVGRSSPCCRPVSSRHEFGAVSVRGLPAAALLFLLVYILCLRQSCFYSLFACDKRSSYWVGSSVKRASLPFGSFARSVRFFPRVQFISFRDFGSFLSACPGSFLSESSVPFRAFGSVFHLDSGGRSHWLATVSMMDLATMTIWYMSSAQVHS